MVSGSTCRDSGHPLSRRCQRFVVGGRAPHLWEFLMTTPSRNTVGVYDRPHPLRTRKVLVPIVVAVVVAIVYAVWWYVA